MTFIDRHARSTHREHLNFLPSFLHFVLLFFLILAPSQESFDLILLFLSLFDWHERF